MANPEHIRWMLEGVEAWNERCKHKDFTPDLEEADIPEEFRKGGGSVRKIDDRVNLSGIDLSGAKLQNAILLNVNLSNANLSGADLKECELNGAILEDANLDYADLRGCEFGFCAQLQRARMIAGGLNTEDFNNTSLCGADFKGADLTDAFLANRETCWCRS